MNRPKKQISIDEYTSPCPITVSPNESLDAIQKLMETEGVRHIPVVLSGKPVGIISDRDLKLVGCFEVITPLKAEDVMIPNPFTVSNEDSLEDVVFEMSKQKIGSALILDNSGEVSGIFTSTDALNALVEVLRGDV